MKGLEHLHDAPQQVCREWVLDEPLPDGTPRAPNAVTARWVRLVERSDAPRLTCHGLRHTHASWSAAEGEHPATTAQRLGHASATITLDRYTHATAGAQRRAQAAIEARMTGRRSPLRVVEGTVEDPGPDSRDHSVTNTGVEDPGTDREAL